MDAFTDFCCFVFGWGRGGKGTWYGEKDFVKGDDEVTHGSLS